MTKTKKNTPKPDAMRPADDWATNPRPKYLVPAEELEDVSQAPTTEAEAELLGRTRVTPGSAGRLGTNHR
jgi:hypothetical protein